MRRANAITAIVSVAVTLVAIEGVARHVYEQPWYDVVIDKTTRERKDQHPYRLNGDRLRMSREITPKPPGIRRLLFLGDSFTFGWGVHDDAAIFPSRLQERLGPSVEVVNGGIPASLTKDWLELWRRLRDRLDADAVVVVFFLRDGTDLPPVKMLDQIRTNFQEEHAASPFYRCPTPIA
jgi:hypothetical protein